MIICLSFIAFHTIFTCFFFRLLKHLIITKLYSFHFDITYSHCILDLSLHSVTSSFKCKWKYISPPSLFPWSLHPLFFHCYSVSYSAFIVAIFLVYLFSCRLLLFILAGHIFLRLLLRIQQNSYHLRVHRYFCQPESLFCFTSYLFHYYFRGV